MKIMNKVNDMPFQEAVRGLLAGDFSRLAPLFKTPSDGSPCPIIKWFEDGLFANAGAKIGGADYPSGDERVAEILRRHGVVA